MGRDPDAESFHQAEFAAHDRNGHAGLDRGPHAWRSDLARQFGRSQSGIRLSQGAGFLRRRVQGHATDIARLEPAASPANPVGRRPHGGLGLAAGRLSASGLGTRYARLRSAGNQMQAAVKIGRPRMWRRYLLSGMAAWLAAASPALA